MIHDELVTYEVAKLAKEKGFDVPTDFCYEQNGCLVRCGSIAAPTQSLLQRWLREEKYVQITINPALDELGAWIWGHYSWVIYIYNEYRPIYYSQFNGDNFCTYEKSLEDALKYALENLV